MVFKTTIMKNKTCTCTYQKLKDLGFKKIKHARNCRKNNLCISIKTTK